MNRIFFALLFVFIVATSIAQTSPVTYKTELNISYRSGENLDAYQKERCKLDIYVPENGFISINTPLTRRRIGSLSTRTTHPYFINSLQLIFNKLNTNSQ